MINNQFFSKSADNRETTTIITRLKGCTTYLKLAQPKNEQAWCKNVRRSSAKATYQLDNNNKVVMGGSNCNKHTGG